MSAKDFIFNKYGTLKTSKDGKLSTKIIAKLDSDKWYASMEEYAKLYHESQVKK